MSGDISAKAPALVYKDLIKLNTTLDNDGITSSLVFLCDGAGTNLPIKVSDGKLQVDNLELDGNTISTLNADGDLVLSPNGTGVINASTSKITNVVDPTSDQDAATKNYCDDTFCSNSAETGQALTLPAKFWKGSQAAYDGLTPDANTIYFITG